MQSTDTVEIDMRALRLGADLVPSFVQEARYVNSWRMFHVLTFDGRWQWIPLEFFPVPFLELTDNLTGSRLGQALDIVTQTLNKLADADGWRAVEAFIAERSAHSNAELRAVIARRVHRRYRG